MKKECRNIAIGFAEWKEKHYAENSYMGETLYYLVTESIEKIDVPQLRTMGELFDEYLKYQEEYEQIKNFQNDNRTMIQNEDSIITSQSVIAGMLLSFSADVASAVKIVERIILPTVGSKADVEFWDSVIKELASSVEIHP